MLPHFPNPGPGKPASSGRCISQSTVLNQSPNQPRWHLLSARLVASAWPRGFLVSAANSTPATAISSWPKHPCPLDALGLTGVLSHICGTPYPSHRGCYLQPQGLCSAQEPHSYFPTHLTMLEWTLYPWKHEVWELFICLHSFLVAGWCSYGILPASTDQAGTLQAISLLGLGLSLPFLLLDQAMNVH